MQSDIAPSSILKRWKGVLLSMTFHTFVSRRNYSWVFLEAYRQRRLCGAG